jgi:hypothetical protein
MVYLSIERGQRSADEAALLDSLFVESALLVFLGIDHRVRPRWHAAESRRSWRIIAPFEPCSSAAGLGAAGNCIAGLLAFRQANQKSCALKAAAPAGGFRFLPWVCQART